MGKKINNFEIGDYSQKQGLLTSLRLKKRKKLKAHCVILQHLKMNKEVKKMVVVHAVVGAPDEIIFIHKG